MAAYRSTMDAKFLLCAVLLATVVCGKLHPTCYVPTRLHWAYTAWERMGTPLLYHNSFLQVLCGHKRIIYELQISQTESRLPVLQIPPFSHSCSKQDSGCSSNGSSSSSGSNCLHPCMPLATVNPSSQPPPPAASAAGVPARAAGSNSCCCSPWMH